MKYFLVCLIVILSIAYLVFAIYLNKQAWKYILKPGTMLCIIILAMYINPLHTSYSFYVLLALIFSLAGDVFLMLEDKWFIHGLASFLLAHIIYIVGFLTSWTFVFSNTSATLIIFILILATVFLKILYPKVYKQGGKLFIVAVAIYIVIISTMLSLAILTGSVLVITAAFLFFISDAILACNKFYVRFRLADYMVMGTYFSAQLLFAISVGSPL
ncbi:lysoplasmalogenase [Ornithinibacillus scapharcae]|uniref:lysoplasmalogenase n=1 Tax=Ornithinibacillus scapharcae TaxID=1147159 RepID=UPI000225C028|nr:lysoplasmalogenase [Ornithinibacillus scapharcae]